MICEDLHAMASLSKIVAELAISDMTSSRLLVKGLALDAFPTIFSNRMTVASIISAFFD